MNWKVSLKNPERKYQHTNLCLEFKFDQDGIDQETQTPKHSDLRENDEWNMKEIINVILKTERIIFN